MQNGIERQLTEMYQFAEKRAAEMLEEKLTAHRAGDRKRERRCAFDQTYFEGRRDALWQALRIVSP